MKIGIIGAGFTGLAAAFYLQKKGHNVTIFERDKEPGGLAIGYHEKGWDWTLEQHYHHWFTNDKSVLDLAAEINHKVEVVRPKTSSYVDGGIYQLDSPVSLLKFKQLGIFDRIRMGASLALLRYNPYWKPLEKFRAKPYLEKSMGSHGYKKIWEPLLVNKLGNFAGDVSLAWFWARVYKRTPSLAYPTGGFLNFAKHLQAVIEKTGGKFYFGSEVARLIDDKKNVDIEVNQYSPEYKKAKKFEFDRVIVTLPSFLFMKIAPQLPSSYSDRLKNLKGIGAINLVLRLNKKFFNDGTYWLNMCDKKSPILAVVEHTNFMDKKNYNNEHLLYIGNYLPANDPRFQMDEKQLLKLYDPWLSKINPTYRKSVIDMRVFKAPFAQPLIGKNYSKNVPPLETPIKNVYLANIEQVYPWDRGTNYAVELGRRVADLIG
ncbi:MAG TPA: FAD-dependent oxidoreductase [Patescibacteria group bacterium]|nr:FAD-dependent oxidoreductase [Patescibacteria group bacterium]